MSLFADAKSHFSIGESLLLPEEIAAQAAAAGYKAAALCDTMTISGMPEFTRACDKHGIKPIIGVRLRIVEDLTDREKQFTVYPKLFILTDEGFRIVTKLLSVANDDDHFYRVPRLIWSDVIDALEHAKGHIAVSTGSLYSALRRSDCIAALEKLSASVCASQAFSEITPAASAVWDRQALEGFRFAERIGCGILLSRPAIIAKPGAMRTLDIMGSIIQNWKRELDEKVSAAIDDYVVKPETALVGEAIKQIGRLRARGEHVDSRFIKGYREDWQRLVDAVTFKWHKLDVSLPVMAIDENAELRSLVIEGLRERFKSTVFGFKPVDLKPYMARASYELDVLTSMGFAGYFLLTREIVMWSKNQGIIVGPGRGSVGGSLVAYALGITNVDPIRFGLFFERFINPERLDLPDADLDFMSSRRHEVIKHIVDTYGESRVAGISNYSTLLSRGALQDLMRILCVSDSVGITKLIPVEQGTPLPLLEAYEQVPEIKSWADKHAEVWQLALDIEGRIRSLSRHAAGIVVAGEPVINRAVVERRSGEATVNWDKTVVEEMGLIKMDILGLSTLDLLSVAISKIKDRHGIDLDLNAIPIDDPDVLKAFGEGRTIGVFQFESAGMRKLLRSLYDGSGSITFEDITAATALYRPGPMESGLMDDFVSIKGGFSSERYEHPSMKAALEETYSVIVYQEQVMQIARDLCGFTMAEADHLRKAIGKKDPVKMAAQGERFISGAIAGGLEEDRAKDLWDKIVKFAGYAFNKSHSVEYTLISYQSMYLKVHYPVEFYAAALTILDDDKKQNLVRDAARQGIQVSPPDINLSTNEFEILSSKELIAPFSIMKGVSERGATEILEARKSGLFKSVADFEARVPRRVINSAVMSKLDKVGALARVNPGSLPAQHPDRRPDQMELIAPIMTGGVTVTRDLHRDSVTKKALSVELQDFLGRVTSDPAVGDTVQVVPKMGKQARFMVVLDGPTYHEERQGKFACAEALDGAISEALEANDMSVEDAYWTAVCKTPKKKGEKLYGPAVIEAYKPLLNREIEILKPQVILTLGSNASRHFASFKSNPADQAGAVIYDKDRDANIVIGLSPGMIYFDSSKQAVLNEAFRIVAEMLG